MLIGNPSAPSPSTHVPQLTRSLWAVWECGSVSFPPCATQFRGYFVLYGNLVALNNMGLDIIKASSIGTNKDDITTVSTMHTPSLLPIDRDDLLVGRFVPLSILFLLIALVLVVVVVFSCSLHSVSMLVARNDPGTCL